MNNFADHARARYADGMTKEVRKIFEAFNEDGDKVITEEEFVNVMHQRFDDDEDTAFEPEELVEMYRYIDLDGDGHVTILELACAMQMLCEPVFPCEKSIEQRQEMLESGDIFDRLIGAGTGAMFTHANTGAEDPLTKGKARGSRWSQTEDMTYQQTVHSMDSTSKDVVTDANELIRLDRIARHSAAATNCASEFSHCPTQLLAQISKHHAQVAEQVAEEAADTELAQRNHSRIIPMSFLDESWRPEDGPELSPADLRLWGLAEDSQEIDVDAIEEAKGSDDEYVVEPDGQVCRSANLPATRLTTV